MTYDIVLTALADPTRRQIFALLRGGASSVNALAAQLPVSRPAVSQHLKILKEAGLVSDQRDGARRLYRLDRAGLAAMRAWLEPFWEEVTAAFNEEWERQLHDRMNT